MLHCITVLCSFLFFKEEEHAGVDSELDDSGSEVDERQFEEQQIQLTEKVIENECSACKDGATSLLASGNNGNQQPSACASEEVLCMPHYAGNQISSIKLSKANSLEARIGMNTNDEVVQQAVSKPGTFVFSSLGSRMGCKQCLCC